MKIEYDMQDTIYSDRAKADVGRKRYDQMTIEAWREERVMGYIRTLVTGGKWLTVGDGNYGGEANWILRNGGNVHASDYSTPLLEIAAKNGEIKEFSRQNAENLTFDDDSFDYVLIKEALHHFPRPWLALYESLRVCRKGVILFEPNGQEPGFLSNVLRVLRRRSYDDYY